MFYTYVLKLSNGKFYVGFSSNLKQRIEAHEKRLVGRTKDSKSIDLVFYAAFENKSKAIKFERYLKTNSGFAFRNKHLI